MAASRAPAPRRPQQRAAPAPRRPRVDPERALERIHANLYRLVTVAVEPIADLEKKWSETELIKRIVNYIYKGAKVPGVFEAPWQEVASKVTEAMMQGYTSACQDSHWFFEIEIAEALGSTVWEIIGGTAQREVSYDEVVDHLGTLYEDALDKVLLDKAFWKACEDTWPDDEKFRGKMHRFLYSTYETSQNEVLADTRTVEPQIKMEKFVKMWMETSMQRAYSAYDALVTEENVGQLFASLVSPFGADHPFSCIPFELTGETGKPDEEWVNSFIDETTTDMFAKWRGEGAAPVAAAGRKTKAKADEDDERQGRSRSPPQRRPTAKGAVKHAVTTNEEDMIHPDCTSAEDCVGDPTRRLVRHLLEGELRDVYCESCWASFTSQNQTLEGFYEDTDEPFE